MIHRSDFGRSSNTGRLLPQVLNNSSLMIHGVQDTRQKILNEMDLLIESHTCVALFPGCHSKPLTLEHIHHLKTISQEKGLCLLIPDGNWNQAKHMVQRIPQWTKIPALELTPQTVALRSMRRNIHQGYMSTFEAAALALGLFEGHDISRQLLQFYERFVDRMLMMRGKIKASEMRDQSQVL